MDTQHAAFDDTSQGSAFVPIEGTATRGGPPITKVDACSAFWLVYSRERYTVMDGQVVPQFKKLHHYPGVGGVDEIRDRRTGERIAVKTGLARSDAQDRGDIIVPFDAIPKSQWHLHDNGGKSYIWRPEGRPDVHLDIWTRVFPGSKEIETDIPNYLAWIAWLEETGVIPRPPSHVLRKMIGQRIAERDALSNRAVTQPALRPAVERACRDIETIEAKLAERMRAEPAAETTPAVPAAGSAFVPDDADAEAPPQASIPAPTAPKGRAR